MFEWIKHPSFPIFLDDRREKSGEREIRTPVWGSLPELLRLQSPTWPGSVISPLRAPRKMMNIMFIIENSPFSIIDGEGRWAFLQRKNANKPKPERVGSGSNSRMRIPAGTAPSATRPCPYFGKVEWDPIPLGCSPPHDQALLSLRNCDWELRYEYNVFVNRQ